MEEIIETRIEEIIETRMEEGLLRPGWKRDY
jgi:hypothetical protein